jgi:16S rRNA (cytosine967-C5)-methyltransferase
LPAENQNQISRFIRQQTDADVVPIIHPTGLETESGWQTLPGCHEMDGFFYSLLRKMA